VSGHDAPTETGRLEPGSAAHAVAVAFAVLNDQSLAAAVDHTDRADGYPDDPPGIDPQSSDMPAVADAAERVIAFISWFGDGRILPDADEQGPPLYARDLEALTRLVSRAETTTTTETRGGYSQQGQRMVYDNRQQRTVTTRVTRGEWQHGWPEGRG
jgi:hypothetical protein